MPGEENNRFGSHSALSLIAESSSFTELEPPPNVIKFIQKKFTYVKLEPDNDIEKINKIIELYSKYLAKIVVPNSNILISYPPIFKKNKDNSYSYLTISEDSKSKIDNWLSLNEIKLSNFISNIIDSSNKLQVLLPQHGERLSVDRVVKEYIIYFLDANLVHFKAKPYDMAYTTALINFVSEFSKNITDLTIETNLQKAYQELDEIYQADNESVMITNLFRTIRNYSEKFLIGLTHVITPSADWRFVSNSNHDDLMDGKYLVSTNSLESKFKKLPDSYIASWIKFLASYQIQSLQSCFSQLNVAELDKIHLTHNLPQEGIEVINEIFNKCDNFITLSEASDIKDRLAICVEWVRLIDIMNAYLLFLTQFSLKHKSLKEFKKNNPYYCSQLYTMHEGLCTTLKRHVDNLSAKFNAIQLDKAELKLKNLEQEDVIFENMKLYLKEISKIIAEYEGPIKELKNRFADFSLQQPEEIKDEMILRLLWLEYRYHFMAKANNEPMKARAMMQQDSKKLAPSELNQGNVKKINKRRIFLHRKYDPIKLSQWENIPTQYTALKIKKIFTDIIKPYKSNTHMIRELLQPIIGLRNICIGAYNFYMGSFPTNRQKVFEGGLNLIRGIIEIITTPLTWFIKFPIRLLNTYVNGSPKIEANVGIKTLAKLGLSKIDKNSKMENVHEHKYSDLFMICNDIHRKYKKSLKIEQDSSIAVAEKEKFSKIVNKPRETPQLLNDYFRLFVEKENKRSISFERKLSNKSLS